MTTEGWVWAEDSHWHYLRDGLALCGFYESEDRTPDPTGGIDRGFEPNCDKCQKVRVAEAGYEEDVE